MDLFCGAGGSSWGAKSAGVRIVAAFDVWSTAQAVYQDNFPNTRFYSRRLEEVDPSSVANELGQIDLILASPECTNHSVARGNRPRCERSRETAFLVTKFARILKPRWLVIENVVSMKNWKRYDELMAEMQSLGYHTTVQTLNAVDFGVPQARRRMFILCDYEKEPSPVVPRGRRNRIAKDIIDTTATYRFSPLRTVNRAKATLERAERAISALSEKKPFLIVYYGTDRAGGWQSVDVPLRTVTTLDRFAYVKPTPNGHMMRMLQPEELKLAMGWPKKFRIIHGPRRSKIKMIGNAVCPPVMQAVLRALVKR